MSAGVVVVIAADVPVVRLAEALAAAGLSIRHDSGRRIIRRAGRVRTIAPELAALLNRLAIPTGQDRPK
jgi:hypothetical protein